MRLSRLKKLALLGGSPFMAALLFLPRQWEVIAVFIVLSMGFLVPFVFVAEAISNPENL